MYLDKLAGIIRSLFHRLMGQGGTTVVGIATQTGKFLTLYVATEATFTAVVGGGPGSQSWLTTIPAGTTITTASGHPVTSFTLSAGLVLAYE